MKVIILTEGGHDIGFGHVTRCLSLYQAFASQGCIPEFIIAGDNSVKYILQEKRFKTLNWLENEKDLFNVLKGVDIAVVDSYLAGIEIYKTISEAIEIPVFIDDFKRLNYPRSIVINWNIHAHDLNYPQNDSITYLLGTDYIALRKAFHEDREKKINYRVGDVLVTFGGDDSKNFTPRVLSFLSRQFPKMRKHVVIGSAFTNSTEVVAAADANTCLISSPDDRGMIEVMLKSDVAISSGGQTLYELARVGVPTVAVVVADNQRGNVLGWEKTGFLEHAGAWTDKNIIVKIEDRFRCILDVGRRARAVAEGRCRVTGNGASEIVDFIMNAINNKGQLEVNV